MSEKTHLPLGAELEVLIIVLIHYEETQSALPFGTLQTYAQDILPLRDLGNQSLLVAAISQNRHSQLIYLLQSLAHTGLISFTGDGSLPNRAAWAEINKLSPDDLARTTDFARNVVHTMCYMVSRFGILP